MGTSFLPKRSSSTSISATTSSASASLDSTCPQVRIYNSGTGAVFVRWGVGAQTALTTDMAIAPGATEAFSVNPGTDTIAAITASGSATVYIICGHGD